jgi:hypothetical protein
METVAGGPLHGELPTEPGFSSTLISLVVLRNAEGRFASTHERDGWYLPAGRYPLPPLPLTFGGHGAEVAASFGVQGGRWRGLRDWRGEGGAGGGRYGRRHTPPSLCGHCVQTMSNTTMAGVPVKLTGILRIEHTPAMRCVRPMLAEDQGYTDVRAGDRACV